MTRARDLASILQNVTPPQTGVVGLSDIQTINNKTIVDYSEYSYTLSGTNIDPANGSIQTIQLIQPIVLTETLGPGQAVTLLISNQLVYTITYPTIVWITAIGNIMPTWTASDVVVFWKIGSTLYGSYAGSYA